MYWAVPPHEPPLNSSLPFLSCPFILLLLALSVVAQEVKFILNYLYQKSRGEGHMSLDAFLAAVRAFGSGEQEDAANQELHKWKVSCPSPLVLCCISVGATGSQKLLIECEKVFKWVCFGQ